MPFIGTQPDVGGYSVLDNLTASATANYTLQKDSANFVPSSANQLLVSLNGVIQKPGTSFTVSGSTLTFSSALEASDSIDFIIAMGEPLMIGTPSDGTVNTTQLATNAVTTAKITDANITTAKIATDAVTSAKLGLTIASGTASQNPNANNTTYNAVQGLTIPDKALMIVQFGFNVNSGENAAPGSNAVCTVNIANNDGTLFENGTATFQSGIGINPKAGYSNVRGQVCYFNNTGSALTNIKIQHQQYADGTFNDSDVRIHYKIVGLG